MFATIRRITAASSHAGTMIAMGCSMRACRAASRCTRTTPAPPHDHDEVAEIDEAIVETAQQADDAHDGEERFSR